MNLYGYSLEILDNKIIYEYESLPITPLYIKVFLILGFLYLIASFFVLKHLLPAISTLGITFIVYQVLLYNQESKHIFDINQKFYYRLVGNDESKKNYIHFNDIDKVEFLERRYRNSKGSNYLIYSVSLILKNNTKYNLFTSRENENILRMQAKLISSKINKDFISYEEEK